MNKQEVVVVHGLWLGNWAMGRLASRLTSAGFRARKFSYSTTREDLQAQTDALFSFARLEDGSLPHFVAHSMGGLITLQMLLRHPEVASGRVVLMGSPVKGSAAAAEFRRWPGGETLLGKARPTLAEGVPDWPDSREVGMIAGTRAFGLGVLAGGARKPGDGTVMSDESQHERLRDRLELPSTHTSMLFSSEAANQAAEFLRTGHFIHEKSST
jgi:pimeloyl-ACP methyl ester carboxylesterase